MNGTLYGVGVGPGDPSLITLKAVKTIKAADIIAVPDTGGEKIALNIVSDYTAGKELMFCQMPMTKDKNALTESHEKCADLICRRLSEGSSVAFITIGDPSVYSTYMYIHKRVVQKGFTAKMVPGVTSFCAAAAALGISLCEGEEPLHIIPASYGNVKEALTLSGTKVLMKSKKKGEIIEALKDLGMIDKARMVECCGMETEKIYEEISEDCNNTGYFSIFVVKENE